MYLIVFFLNSPKLLVLFCLKLGYLFDFPQCSASSRLALYQHHLSSHSTMPETRRALFTSATATEQFFMLFSASGNPRYSLRNAIRAGDTRLD